MSKTSEEFFKAINETDLFILLKKTFLKGDFVNCPVDSNVAKGEFSLGPLTDLEKAIFLTAFSIPEKHAEYHMTVGDHCNPHLCILSRIQEEALLNLLWATIYTRLQDRALKFPILGVRKNWQIVGIYNENPCCFENETLSYFNNSLS